MSKKPRLTVTITAKLSPELADPFYRIVNERFGGNISAAMRDAITLLLKDKSSKDPPALAEIEVELPEVYLSKNSFL